MQKVTHISCKAGSDISELISQVLCHDLLVFSSFFFFFLFFTTAPLYVEGTCLVAWDHSSWYL